MNEHGTFRIESIRLPDGTRVLRVEDPGTGVCLERHLRADMFVARQRVLLEKALRDLLTREPEIVDAAS